MEVSTAKDFDYQGMVILGASGNIGTRLIERVTESDYPAGEQHENAELADDKNPINHQHPTKIIAIADSTRFYVDLNGIPAELLRTSEDTKTNVKNVLADLGVDHYGDLSLIPKTIRMRIDQALNPIDIDLETEITPPPVQEEHIGYVDLTDSIKTKPVYDFVTQHSQSAVVAVSKKVLGYADKAQFDAYKNSGRVELLPTVGAGMDAIAHLANYPESRESLIQVDAMVSGTNLAICKGLESEAYKRGEIELHDLVYAAWKAGDTEPYADTDIGESESDTWVKARIMAMSAGLQALPADIKAGMPFVPKDIGDRFSKDTMADYIQAIADNVNQPMRDYVEANITKTHTLRHIARIKVDAEGNEAITVGLEQVPRDSEFATSEQNVIIIKDDTETVILKKPGAGRDVTCKSIEQAFRNLVPRGLARQKVA